MRSLLLVGMLAACDGLRATPSPYTGTIEVTEVEVSAAIPGRLVDIRFEEGDTVALGDLAFVLDGEKAEAEVAVLEAAVEAAAAGVDTVRTQVAAADAQVALLQRELDRAERLQSAGVGTPQQISTLRGQRDVARAQAAAARAQVEMAQKSEAQAHKALEAAQTRLDDLEVHAAVAGVVLSRNREPGEVVGPGVSVLTLGDLTRPRLRVYVPLLAVEGLSVGDAVDVVVDAHPETPFAGTVAKVAKQAEFTPRDILTPEERVKRVFAVDIALDAAPGLLPGVPAEARFTP